ncbi:hypothetical protein JCM10908_001117 [Rhodotorula pacifica]|uniref:uncharacterized protein n=1 Tax=Rhodotorula pacifica TaxID=1495444 RepID=UPI00317B0591
MSHPPYQWTGQDGNAHPNYSHNYAKRARQSPPHAEEPFYEDPYGQATGISAYSDASSGPLYPAQSAHPVQAPPYHSSAGFADPYSNGGYAQHDGQNLDPRYLTTVAPLPSISAADTASWTRTVPNEGHPSSFLHSTSIFLPQPLQTPAASDAEGAGKPPPVAEVKKTASTVPRKRRPASCTPCRQKKLRCSRAKPCTSCVERNVECIWEGDATPLYIASQESDIERLQAHVKQLESLVGTLPANSDSFRTGPAASARAPSSSRSADIAPSRTASAPSGTRFASEEPERFDLAAQDILGALVSLVMTGSVTPPRAGRDSFLPNGQSGSALIQEFKLILAANTPTEVETPKISALAVTEDLTLPDIMALLPPEPKLRAAYDFFHEYYAWICPSVSTREIDKRWPAMKKALDSGDATHFAAPADAQALALVLSVCTVGISRMPEELAAQLILVEEKATNGAEWARVTSLVLYAGRPTESPHLDGVRAANTIGVYHLLMTQGKTVHIGVALISLGSQAAMELGLNRDPVDFPFYEREMRRRTFWALFTISVINTSYYSRTWSAFDLRYIDCAFPGEYHEEELEMDERAANARLRARANAPEFEETWISSQIFHFRIGYLGKVATDDLFAASACSYEALLASDKKLVELEASMPEVFQFGDFHNRPPTLTTQRAILLHVCLAAEVVRINRPFLALAAADDRYRHARERCIEHAKRELYMYSGRNGDWIEFSTSRFSAAMCVAIDLLSKHPEDVREKRELLEFASLRLDATADVSPVHRRGALLLKSLLEKVNAHLDK